MNRFWKEYFIFMEKKTNTLKKALTGIILSVILIVIDQVTKFNGNPWINESTALCDLGWSI